MAKGGGTQETTQTMEPWEQQRPYLEKGFQRADDWYGSNVPEFYRGSTVAPFAPESEAALGLTAQRALEGSPLISGAQGELGATMGGAYLGAGNPYLASAYNAAANPMVEKFREAVMPGIDSRASAAGRYGSGAHQNMQENAYSALGDSLGNMAAGMAYQNYGDERGRMMQGIGLAPQLAAQDYEDMARLAGVGSARESMQQANIGEDIQRWNFEQNRELNKLAQYMGLVQGNYGGESTSTQPGSSGSTLGNILGAGAGIAGIASGIPGIGK